MSEPLSNIDYKRFDGYYTLYYTTEFNTQHQLSCLLRPPYCGKTFEVWMPHASPLCYIRKVSPPQYRGIHRKGCHVLFTIDQLRADSPPSNSYLLRPSTWRSFHSRVHSETDSWSCTNGLTRLAGVIERLGIFNFASRCLVRVPRTNQSCHLILHPSPRPGEFG